MITTVSLFSIFLMMIILSIYTSIVVNNLLYFYSQYKSNLLSKIDWNCVIIAIVSLLSIITFNFSTVVPFRTLSKEPAIIILFQFFYIIVGLIMYKYTEIRRESLMHDLSDQKHHVIIPLSDPRR